MLEQQGYQVEVVDPFAERLSYKQYIDKILASAPDVLGLSATSDAYFTTVKVCQTIKRLKPDTTIILGGPHPTLLGETILESLPQSDIIVRGEGEQAICNIMQRIAAGRRDFSGIVNTTWRDGDRIIRNPETELVSDLDSLPFPAFHLVNYENYDLTYTFKGQGTFKAVNIISSRGCPFNCAFCSNSNIWGNKVRYRSLENVIEEMKLRISQLGVNFFQFQDDAFNLSPQRLRRFCDLLEEEKLDIGFSCGIRADNADLDLLGRMKEVGLKHTYFSVEHINDHIRQDCLGKALSREKINTAIEALEQLDIGYSIAFMVSLPDEGPEEMKENLRFMSSFRPKHPESETNLNLTRIYPGTRLEKEALKRNVLRPGFSWVDQKRMRRFSPGVFTGLMGEVPLFKEGLSYLEMFSCLFIWRKMPTHTIDPQKTDSLLAYGWYFLRSMRYPKDFLLLFWLLLSWVVVEYRSLRGRLPGSDNPA